jgi:hypothetical protein
LPAPKSQLLEAPKRFRRGRLLLAAGAVLALGLAVLGLRRSQHDTLERPPLVAENQVPVPVATNAPPATKLPVVAPAPDGRVEIEIVGPPSGTQVRIKGGKPLGSAPGKIVLDRSDSPLELELSRAGYASVVHTLIPARATRLDVTLRPLAPKAARRAPHPDEAEQPTW